MTFLFVQGDEYEENGGFGKNDNARKGKCWQIYITRTLVAQNRDADS